MPEDMLAAKRNRVVKLKDVKVPNRFYQRHQTGFEVLDQVFGGDNPGVLPGGAYLVTGMPGSGKSTLLLQMIDAWTRQGLRVVYNIGEESIYQVKMAADRIKVSGDFEVTQFKDATELIMYVTDPLNPVDIVVQDSLQSLADETCPWTSDERRWLHIGKRLIEMSKDHIVTTFVINHVTKDGAIRGKNELVHDADAHVHISISKESGNRIVALMKNRFGPAQMPYEFVLNAGGIDLTRASEGVEGTRANQRKEQMFEVIEKLLLDGKKLSGYSHEEEPEIVALGISGGAMRAALRMVSKKLGEKGFTVRTEHINRREHTYVEKTS